MNANTETSHDSGQLDAEQLLKMMDLQLIAARQRREANSPSRTGFRVFSIALIIVILMGSLWVAMYLLEEMKADQQREPVPEGFVEEVR